MISEFPETSESTHEWHLEERGEQSRVPGENPFWPAFKSVSCCIIINNCLLRLGKKMTTPSQTIY